MVIHTPVFCFPILGEAELPRDHPVVRACYKERDDHARLIPSVVRIMLIKYCPSRDAVIVTFPHG